MNYNHSYWNEDRFKWHKEIEDMIVWIFTWHLSQTLQTCTWRNRMERIISHTSFSCIIFVSRASSGVSVIFFQLSVKIFERMPKIVPLPLAQFIHSNMVGCSTQLLRVFLKRVFVNIAMCIGSNSQRSILGPPVRA